MTFTAVLLSNGKTATGIHVPDHVVSSLGPSKKPAVRVTINGHTYRSTVASRSGRFLLGVSAENRAAAGVAAGDVLEVDIELDTEPRVLNVPVDLAGAIDGDLGAKRYFDGLSYSKRQWFVLSVEGARTAETRQRRIAKAVEMLREGRTR
jgi:hypothetical protein